MNQHVLSVGLVFAVLFSASAVCAEDEWDVLPLGNPSFEEGENLPTGWRALQGNNPRPSLGSVMAWDREFARTGERSLYIRRGDIGPLRWRIGQAVPIDSKYRYKVRVWFRINPTNVGEVGIGVRSRRTLESTGRLWETSRYLEVEEETQGQWQLLEFEFTTPTAVEKVWLTLGQGGSWPPNGHPPIEVWFDDISLMRQLK